MAGPPTDCPAAPPRPLQVVRAMQETVKNLVGTLPPQFFTVKISTMGDNLAQLMSSVLLTGYMFRNAQYRMELRGSLATGAPAGALPSSTSAGAGRAAGGVGAGLLSTIANFRFGASDAPASSSSSSTSSTSSSSSSSSSSSTTSSAASSGTSASQPASPTRSSASSGGGSGGALALSLSSATSSDDEDEDGPYAPGVQKSNIDGQVLRWHKENGLERMTATQYIELLEQEVLSLRQQARAAAAAAGPVLQVGGRWGAGGWHRRPRRLRAARVARPGRSQPAGSARSSGPPNLPCLRCCARKHGGSTTSAAPPAHLPA
jgi:hypothetical protein